MKDPRPEQYLYYKQLMKYLNNIGKDESVFFNGELIYPRQFEIHLPADHKKSCQLFCSHCAGKYFDKTLGTWEMDALKLLEELDGKIPYHIYGGAYTEPLMNPYFMTFLHMTKKYSNHFGIHTNGILLNNLENNFGWLTELNRIATDDIDYLSISIDAGTPSSWGNTKGTTKYHLFDDIIEGIKKASKIRDKKGKTHAIRLCYLISQDSGNKTDFESIVRIAKEFKVDSLRFSIPFAPYNQSFSKVKEYKMYREVTDDPVYTHTLKNYLSESKEDRPYIFYTGPEFTDIDKYTFDKCIYGFFQVTYSADGYAYKCSTTATPTAKHCRLGKITGNLEEFNKMVIENQNPNWSCKKMCFNKGLRCNRMGLEICKEYEALTNV